jgi:hypothetical protein
VMLNPVLLNSGDLRVHSNTTEAYAIFLTLSKNILYLFRADTIKVGLIVVGVVVRPSEVEQILGDHQADNRRSSR